MRFTITVRELLDTIIEQVAIKTGILLTDHDVKRLLKAGEMKEWLYVFRKRPNEVLAVRPEFIEDFVRVLRAILGNLPDASPAAIHSIQIFKEISETGIDPMPAFAALDEILETGKYKVLGEEAAQEIAQLSGVPISIVIKILLALAEHQERGLNPFFSSESKDWDGAIPLNMLFNSELLPANPDKYLDQRFIDYLAANNKELDKMHWRNFERLCAEFFKRFGYEVDLGPGGSDGGVDIRIWSDAKRCSGPPLLLIQCKRYKKGDTVKIEYIKALWSDVVFEKAVHGLLITTSYVALGGKKISQARKWPLSVAENSEVNKMVKTMWRHAWTGKGKTKGVGVYPLPPVLPLS